MLLLGFPKIVTIDPVHPANENPTVDDRKRQGMHGVSRRRVVGRRPARADEFEIRVGIEQLQGQRAVLVFQDAADRVFDFHSLRHQYVSNLAAAGVHPKIAQTLARHSTITLTMDRYTHLGLRDLDASVNSLPAVPVTLPENRAVGVLKATGTDDSGVSEVPTVVPSGAENGAILPASGALRIAPDCTETREKRKRTDALTPERDRTIRTKTRHVASGCTNGNERGPSRIRTGDGGFAIR
ncbi:MAG: hypothetical protein FJ303_04730, partial [Planctomycetes bacterium]|nr:hypothetical protein [Planctomycetota bacterium]